MEFRVSFTTFAWRLSVVLVLLAGLAAPAFAQQSTLRAVPVTAELRGVIDQGMQLETQRRWGEALTLYEEALREHPGQGPLEQRFETAKLHYDLGRRYGDASYQKSLVQLKEPDALSLYSEVLLKIQSHYVEEPDWKRLVDRGTIAVSAALDDELFMERYLRDVPAAKVNSVRRELQAKVGAFLIRSRHEARDAVAWAAQFSNQQMGLPVTVVVMEYMCGASNLLDDYSAFLTSDQLNEVYSQIEGNFVGLGIELKAKDGALQILRVIPGSPADRGGMKPHDQIVAVDGQVTEPMSTDQAANMLQGKEGTFVEVKVVTPGEPARSLRLRREHVEVPSVDDVKILDVPAGVGFLKLSCFQKTTSRDLDAALWNLHRQGMKSLIMDLRGNPGGLLSSSVEVVDKFVPQGRIVSTKGRSPQEDYNYSAHAPGTWKVPLVVLIDGDSASASEIFAGAIRDHNRGTIVGSRSYGKGSVQGIFPLTMGNAGIRLTTAKFFSPNGLPFSKVGVMPHIKVQQVAKPTGDSLDQPPPADANDPVVAAGIRVAKGEIPKR